jgi:hypothetical protein
MLLGHPTIHQGTRAASPAKMLHAGRMRMVCLPPRQFDQWLIFLGLLPLEAIHPCEPPVSTYTLFIAANIALVTFAVRHLFSPAAEIITLFKPTPNLSPPTIRPTWKSFYFKATGSTRPESGCICQSDSSTASKSVPLICFNLFRSESSHRESGTPMMNQGLPLSDNSIP